MPTKRLYSFASLAGTFYICASSRFYYAMLDSSLLDFYSSPEKVALAVALRFNPPPAPSRETKTLTVPANLEEWEKLY